MTTILVGDIVKLTSRYARGLMKNPRRSNKPINWHTRRGVAKSKNRNVVYVAWPDRKTLDPVPHAGVEKA